MALAVILAALAAVAWPLFSRVPPALGRGLEDDAPLVRWGAERDRLVAAMRDNDMALAERRMDPATHQATALRLAAEAERVLSRLRAARDQFAAAPAAEVGAMRAGGRFAHAGLLALTLAAGLAAAWAARWQDIDLTGSPHADGSVPLDGSPGAPPVDAEGMPDIGAMVAGLEARVADGDASPDEIKMLLRSYDTLGRFADARPVLDAALARFPGDPELQIAWLRVVVSLPRPGDAALALPVADRLIAAMPDLLEARWYRSLLLVAEGRRDEARAELMWMAPLLPEGSPARGAVEKLIKELAQPAAEGEPP